MRYFFAATIAAALTFLALTYISNYTTTKIREAKSYANRLLVETDILKP